jgi:hypothetical protein
MKDNRLSPPQTNIVTQGEFFRTPVYTLFLTASTVFPVAVQYLQAVLQATQKIHSNF